MASITMRRVSTTPLLQRLLSILAWLAILVVAVFFLRGLAYFLGQQKALTTTIVLNSLRVAGGFVGLIALGVVALEFVLYLILVRWLRWKYAIPYMLLAPAAIGLAFLVLYPFAYNFAIAFSNRSLTRFLPGTYSFSLQYGIENFKSVFTDRVLHDTYFYQVFARTIAWTAINVFFHVLGGLGLALLLNRALPLRGLYRTILVFPWAIPQPIVALALRGEFHYQYGFVNNMLKAIGLTPVQWLSEPIPAFVAVTLCNIWLGIPFMMVIILGGLQSISREFYEASEIDGAGGWAQFRSITWPLLQPVVTPAAIIGTI
jgi:arabinogalactan oligomer/maltooligosaccharide transport system permease protein